jgi:AmiR/NasT family two-component response regulator
MNTALSEPKGTLLSIIEIGAYPNFTPLYEKAGYAVTIERSMRKALPQVRKLKPAVIVAEFNFQSDFRDRTSSLESLLAVIQTLPATRVIVFYDAEQAHQFERLSTRFPIHAALTYPIDPVRLEAALISV